MSAGFYHRFSQTNPAFSAKVAVFFIGVSLNAKALPDSPFHFVR